MTERLTIIPQPIAPGSGKTTARKPQATPAGGIGSFDQLLRTQLDQGGVKFSKHAIDRMNSRGIQFDSTQMQRIEQAVSRVEAKGGKDSLVMIDDAALVVSVKNDTVVTVVDKEQLRSNVFTNIDSAVIA